VGLLSWLGLRHGDAYPNVDALMKELRRALPDDESVVLRYIAVVSVLLGKVAWADGRFSSQEEEALRSLLTHIDRIAPSGVEAVCAALRGQTSTVTDGELTLCYRELKSLCDLSERREVIRLLARLAAADGVTSELEQEALEQIAAELGVSQSDLESVEDEVAREATHDELPDA
jgi:uncharacterized tellurite resistance protein B-like protein